MSTAYVSQIEPFAFGFAPKNWLQCAGQTLAIQQNQALFSLLGTTYGGDGITTFKLPDLRGRLPVGMGQGPGLESYTEGQVGGVETVTLTQATVPQHNHLLNADAATTTGITNTPSNTSTLGRSSGTAPSGAFTVNMYGTANPSNTMYPGTVVSTSGGQPHTNLMPYLCINFCMCIAGIFPSRN